MRGRDRGWRDKVGRKEGERERSRGEKGDEKQLWKNIIKGCGMGTLFVLVSPCVRENVVVTCKIGSFLCSLDNLLQKNVIVFFFFFEIKFQNGAHLKKGLFLTYFTQCLVTRAKLQKFLQHISHSHIYMHFAHPIDFFFFFFFCLSNFEKKYEFIRYGFSLV